MDNYLTKTDWDRIQEFADTPVYDRDPEMLVPRAEDDDSEE